ncbi:28S ribosomal protein S18b, mitochondrial [Toxorhynchites rutilus septentrionalis]|uniref:28S ribosomal protein S18b, mitochondrial n=1 Tax=Toxorhynchites rutilus septentrionalis TaxID=329112 RepID=UPI0024797B13|nr:28S ribosomal protein S18b, mitochondrial [Toxorhynchites rutilus septentrionalis]
MSLFRVVGKELFYVYRRGIASIGTRCITLSSVRLTAGKETSSTIEEDEENENKPSSGEDRDDPKDRTRVIPVETSIRYLASEAFQQTYQGDPVWKQYRRNHKGLYPPKKTRKTCIRGGKLSTGNPCPICRDEYLVLDHRNIDLIKQFISPHSGEVLSYQITGLCQKKHLQLLVAVERAMDYGLITFEVPFRNYDYSEYYTAQQ